MPLKNHAQTVTAIILSAVTLTAQATNGYFDNAYGSCSKGLAGAGKKLSEAFKGKKTVFPGIVIKIIEAGEKTGTLDKSMEEIAEYMDYQVTSSLKTVVSLLEPLMLVFVGLLVGGMMMSIIGPIYGLISQVGGK